MSNKLVCWQCGGSLVDVPRPIRRLTRCPHCRCDLHVCRLCTHYTTRYIGECSHDRAERVLDKTAANFCAHFRPRANAHLPPVNPELEQASAALGALFGIDEGGDSGGVKLRAGPDLEAAERARRELESLFGVGAAKDGGDTGPSDDPPARTPAPDDDTRDD